MKALQSRERLSGFNPKENMTDTYLSMFGNTRPAAGLDYGTECPDTEQDCMSLAPSRRRRVRVSS